VIVFIIDKHPLIREILSALLYRQNPGLKVIELDNFGSVSAAISSHGLPRLISLELNLSDTRGVSGVEYLKKNYPDVTLIVLSEFPAKIMAYPSLMAGADCYIEKSTTSEEVVAIFKKKLLNDAAIMPCVDRPTKRQLEILRLVEKGLDNKSIANTLDISCATVNVHLYRLYKLIHAKNRIQAIKFAKENGFLPLH
jgi:DNA-binding NarL/FixJ family response regulator